MKKGFSQTGLKPSPSEHMNDNRTSVSALYDSHVHWLMTGEKKSYFDIQKFERFSEIASTDFKQQNFRGDWIFGFGWDDSHIANTIALKEVDRLSPTLPLCFIKKDAHSCLLNSVALKQILPYIENVPTLKPFIERDSSGVLTGVLKESAFYSIYAHIPALSASEIRRCLLVAQDYFLKNGFTHIRDMTCSMDQWAVLKDMQRNGELKIVADINFNAETVGHALDTLIPFAISERSAKHRNLNIQGIKIFSDGSLGSNTAWLFENYKGTTQNGFGLWSNEDMLSVMKQCWQNNLEFSVHTLGDKAVDSVVDLARSLYSQKIRGYLNLEHVQLLAPETIIKMKSLFVRCHMQPSHWLSDKKFLNVKLNPKTLKNLFAWEALRRAKVPLSFGSDSPIEEANVALTRTALEDSAHAGIEPLQEPFLNFYTYPVVSIESKSYVTHFDNGNVVKVDLPPVHTGN
ncbi:MAG: amidohydrolase family protein [Bdellovibrionaceae bacterium]|nr:amidohydrolase family protein [Pseudobdellovibrionaceae bacterium]